MTSDREEVAAGFPPGVEFAGRPRAITAARMLAFSGGPLTRPGWPAPNIHTSTEIARSSGLPGRIASGTQYQSFIVELMIDVFGEAWLAGGKMAVKLVDLVEEGQVVRARARVTGVEEGDRGTEVHLDVWCEREGGAKVLVGTAAGRAPRARAGS